VSQQRLKRFFTKEGNFFQIRKDIRERVVFSEQDVLQDPPFSKLHLLCCRNLLIYLKPEAQKKLLPLFHYTLVSEGILVLGSSESIGSFSNLYAAVDKKWKIFRRKEVSQSMQPRIQFPEVVAKKELALPDAPPVGVAVKNPIGPAVHTALLEAFTPVAVLVDEDGNIQYVQGRTGKYLETGSGTPSHNIVDMARPGLRIEMSSALREAAGENRAVVRKHVGVRTNGDVQVIDLHVRPQTEPVELKGKYLVVFEDVDTPAVSADPDGEAKEGSMRDRRISELEKELQSTRESHQSTIEELESSNEELKSTNEELQSSNEELQSSNEELESSKEELQSLNEELHTVNAELQSKVDELSKAHDDMRNLLNSTEIATVFVDNEMKIKRFTTGAGEIFNLIQTDIDRPLPHLTSNLTHEGLVDDLSRVLDKLTPVEKEVRNEAGEWFKMRIIPYRTTDNRIDGAVLTFVSIDAQKKDREAVASVFELNPDALSVIDRDGSLILANQAFCRLFDLEKNEAAGSELFELRDGLLEGTDLKDRLETAMADEESFEAADLEIDERRFSVKGQFLPEDSGYPSRLFLAFRERWEKR